MMVAEGSGGAHRDQEFILNRMPLAQANQFVTLFYAKHHISCIVNLPRGADSIII